MTEKHALPAIAASAFNLANQQFQREVNELVEQTLTSMGLKQADGWRVNLENGTVFRDVPDPEKPDIEPPQNPS